MVVLGAAYLALRFSQLTPVEALHEHRRRTRSYDLAGADHGVGDGVRSIIRRMWPPSRAGQRSTSKT